jgi:two-component system OmpR family response regulator
LPYRKFQISLLFLKSLEKGTTVDKKLIFVVDDDPLITSLVAARLSNDGYEVRVFAYGEECLAALNENPDLIILDFYFVKTDSVPLNGMEVFDQLCTLAPEIPVIMLSAQEKGEVVLEFARKGIADYVIKDSGLADSLHLSVKNILEK